MEKQYYISHKEKTRQVGFRLSEYERLQLEDFCDQFNTTISEFMRFAVAEIINHHYEDNSRKIL